jgi:response regulator RpfG family c-di-GMP phosphodiesterase
MVISDVGTPRMGVASLFREMARNYPNMRRVILTAYLDIEEIMAAINLGRIHRYLIKPIKPEAMLNAVSEELNLADGEEITRLKRAIEQLTDQV